MRLRNQPRQASSLDHDHERVATARNASARGRSRAYETAHMNANRRSHKRRAHFTLPQHGGIAHAMLTRGTRARENGAWSDALPARERRGFRGRGAERGLALVLPKTCDNKEHNPFRQVPDRTV